MGVSIFNTGYDLQDQIDAAESAIAIVSIGDTHVAITSGQYVYVREHGTLAEGLYRATANIAANGTLSGSNVTAVSGGGLNALNSKFANLYTQYSNNWVDSLSVTLPKQGAYLFVSQRFAQMVILMRFSNGNTTSSIISGTNWTFTAGTNGQITGAATNIADYYIIPLMPI